MKKRDKKRAGKKVAVQFINLGYTPPQGGSRWSLPLDIERVTPQSSSIDTALKQTHRLMKNKALPFGTAPSVINEADSGYATPPSTQPIPLNYQLKSRSLKLKKPLLTFFTLLT